MNIGNDWKIEPGDEGYVISKKHRNQKDKRRVYWVPEYYTLHLVDAYRILIDARVRKTGLKDLKTVMEEIKHLREDIERCLTAREKTVKGN